MYPTTRLWLAFVCNKSDKSVINRCGSSIILHPPPIHTYTVLCTLGVGVGYKISEVMEHPPLSRNCWLTARRDALPKAYLFLLITFLH